MYTCSRILFPVACLCFLLNALQVLCGGGGGEKTSLVLSCGSQDVQTDDLGRKWDSDNKFAGSGESKTVRATFQDPSLQSTVPYMDARAFSKEFSYKFPIESKQRYFVRFHFYPSTYPGFNITNSYFSVVANDVTLLSNFSVQLTAHALTQAYLIKEYSLAPMDSDTLTITFKPSDKYPGSFAFVNGIELIPTPDLFGSGTMVGFSDEKVDAENADLETIIRLNVGGQYISATNDSGGLMRTWYDDILYMYGAAAGIYEMADEKLKIDYKDLPEYTAPYDVYRTARSMGPEKNVNLGFNLTWTFRVDANFTYLVRLHFCEIQYTKVNQRPFNIYINNQTAQVDPPADVIGWTGAKGVPTYRDYTIFIDDKADDDEVWVAITPNVENKPEYNDALLNGLELFKMSTDKKLAGPNPEVSAMLDKDDHAMAAATFSSGNSSSNMQVIGGAAGGAAAIGLVAAICIVVYQRKKRVPGTDSHTSSWLPIYGHSQTSGTKSTISGKSNASSHLSAMAQGLCRRFSFAEIKQATKNFDESYVIGVGGFGKVYKGVLDGMMKVAIKRSNPSSEQGVNEFVTEIEMLSKLRHKHLVSLIGFCEEDEEMCLVYDYMALGTLREHIYNIKKPQSHLSWKQRLEICIGAARGLHYLHTGAKYTIIHRDVKTTNILLDEHWVAKVSDFGLSKTGPNMENGHVSTVVKGSFGYLDPEYFRRQQLTEKSDIYSFGVVLFEVLCARPALNPSLPKDQVSLADWALCNKRKETLEDIIDPHLKGKITPECLKKFADTAEKCLSDNGVDRPSMGDVLWNLEFCLQLEESASSDGSSSRSSRRGASNTSSEDLSLRNRPQLHISNLSLGSESDLNEQPEDTNSSAIFSQIVNPTGR